MQMTIRKTIRGNLALVTFLWSYAVFTVAGNLVYLVPGGDTIAHYSIKQFSLSAFDTRGSAGYMALLMLPFVVAPPVAFFTRVLIGKFIASRVRKVDEITSRDFSVIFALAFCYVAYSFWRSGAAGMLQQGGDFLDAVRLRFICMSRSDTCRRPHSKRSCFFSPAMLLYVR